MKAINQKGARFYLPMKTAVHESIDFAEAKRYQHFRAFLPAFAEVRKGMDPRGELVKLSN
jgi:hypothetical protein